MRVVGEDAVLEERPDHGVRARAMVQSVALGGLVAPQRVVLAGMVPLGRWRVGTARMAVAVATRNGVPVRRLVPLRRRDVRRMAVRGKRGERRLLQVPLRRSDVGNGVADVAVRVATGGPVGMCRLPPVPLRRSGVGNGVVAVVLPVATGSPVGMCRLPEVPLRRSGVGNGAVAVAVPLAADRPMGRRHLRRMPLRR